MEKESIEEFRKKMEKEDTGVLRRIWYTEYRNEWTNAQFEVVGQILRERGEDLSTQPQREANAPMQSPNAAKLASEYAPSRYAASSYAGLRGIASLCTGLGWLIIGLAGLGAISGLAAMGERNGFAPGLAIIITSIATGGFFFIILRVIAEGISVLLDIEANTRQAAINTQRTATILEQYPKIEKAAY